MIETPPVSPQNATPEQRQTRPKIDIFVSDKKVYRSQMSDGLDMLSVGASVKIHTLCCVRELTLLRNILQNGIKHTDGIIACGTKECIYMSAFIKAELHAMNVHHIPVIGVALHGEDQFCRQTQAAMWAIEFIPGYANALGSHSAPYVGPSGFKNACQDLLEPDPEKKNGFPFYSWPRHVSQ